MNFKNIFLFCFIIIICFLSLGCKEVVSFDKSYTDFINDADAPALNKEMLLPIKGDTVAAYAFIANDSTRKETVILVSGYPGNDNNFDLAYALRRNNRNVIHFNHRGAWGSQGEYTYSNCLEDIDEIIKYLSRDDISMDLRIDPTKMVLLGRSYGGGISLIQGSQIESINKIIAISSVNYGKIMENYQSLDELSGFKKYMKKQIMMKTNIDSFLQEMLDKKKAFNILSYKQNLEKKKVLLIEDSDKNDVWTKEIKNAEIIKIKTDHNFIDKRIKMINTVIEWLDKD